MDHFGYLTTSDTVSIRYGRWPAGGPVRGSAVVLSGRFEFMEKYKGVIRRLNRRGLDVYSFDWRGQGLSTRLLDNRHKGHVAAYEDYIADLDLFMERVVGNRAALPSVLLTHSMGGHIALRWLHRRPRGVERLVLVSPMIDIRTAPFPKPLARALARTACRFGFADAYVPGAGDYVLEADRFPGNRLTADPEGFLVSKREIVKNPGLALGGVTYGWLSATFASIDRLKRPGHVAAIPVPVLLVSAGEERVVSVPAQRRLCRALPDCRCLTIPGARHEILMEVEGVKDRFWQAFDRFMIRESGTGSGEKAPIPYPAV
jgi:lysophospholipase